MKETKRTMANIDDLIDDVIEREGGYANHPADRGGQRGCLVLLWALTWLFPDETGGGLCEWRRIGTVIGVGALAEAVDDCVVAFGARVIEAATEERSLSAGRTFVVHQGPSTSNSCRASAAFCLSSATTARSSCVTNCP